MKFHRSIHTLLWAIALLIAHSISGQTIDIQPVVFGIHRHDGGTWYSVDKPISYAGWGVTGKARYGSLRLEADFILTRFFGIAEVKNRFSPEHGIFVIQNVTESDEEFDTYYARMKIAYQSGPFVAYMGLLTRNLGPAHWSVVLSEKAPAYPQYGFDWRLSDGLRYTYIRGDLFSGISQEVPGASFPGYEDSLGVHRVYLERYLAAHRLEWDVFPGIQLGLMETLVYGGRSSSLVHHLPFVPLYAVQYFFGDQDNLQMSADLTWRPYQGLRIYGLWYFDEWRPEWTFRKRNRNWFAWQGGLEWRSIFKAEDQVIAEATWIDHRVYRHKFPINDLYSHRYPMGYWTGPHAQSLLVSYMLPLGPIRGHLQYLYAERGELTFQMLVDQQYTRYYERFSGITEKLRILEFTGTYNVWQELWLALGISKIWWENPGFNPAVPRSNDPIEKLTLELGFYYNFNLPGYTITTMR